MLDQGPCTRAAFERALQHIVGRSVRTVTYYEIAYDDGEPLWNRESASFDSLDFGLDLHLDDGAIVSFTWGAEFVQYNVSVQKGPLQLRDTVRRWDAEDRWRAFGLLDRPILGASGVWVRAELASTDEYPQDVRITFDSRHVVVISAFECRGDGSAMGMMDHITVFFDEVEARRLVHGAT